MGCSFVENTKVGYHTDNRRSNRDRVRVNEKNVVGTMIVKNVAKDRDVNNYVEIEEVTGKGPEVRGPRGSFFRILNYSENSVDVVKVL
mgnify:CR=1